MINRKFKIGDNVCMLEFVQENDKPTRIKFKETDLNKNDFKVQNKRLSPSGSVTLEPNIMMR